jgi:hypothetical protein
MHCDEVQGVSGNFSADCCCTKSVCLLPSRKTYSSRKTRFSVESTTVSKNLIKQLHTLPVLHFNRCLTTVYSETTAHFNGNFDTDNQIYVGFSESKVPYFIATKPFDVIRCFLIQLLLTSLHYFSI